MYNIQIVKMNLSHIDEVMVVEHLCFTIPWSKGAFIEEITNNKFARYFAVLADGKVVGYAGMWKVFDEGHITNIAIHPDFRGRGIGSATLENIIARAKDEEITRMTLEVRKGNFIAQALYKKYGFEAAGLRKGYYADNNEDALIMWKEEI
jgi:[ribosomal protein S18]-alanine N-acetyltransferase